MALIAFAANSVLCRLALGSNSIDAATFTIIRLVSGVLVLQFILRVQPANDSMPSKGSWTAALMLFTYAICFSYAYITLDTGTGALILFGAVQITMIMFSLLGGDRLHFSQWIGVLIAFAGFVILVLPGVTTPSLAGFTLMTLAGIAWGGYTLKGKGSANPLMDTTFNFTRTLPVVAILAAITLQNSHYTREGIMLAVLSGGIASGIGYAIWYTALGSLSAIQAAVLQLLVPVIAAVGGIIFVAEAITLRLTFSAIMILGGILLVFLGRYYSVRLKL
jgi:drug/metabolite transporter (DMT)-like permease